VKVRDHLEFPGVGGKNNVKIGLTELGFEGADWIHLTHASGRLLQTRK